MTDTPPSEPVQPSTAKHHGTAQRRSAAPSRSLKRLPGYLSVRETAERLGLCMRSVYAYLENGRLDGTQIGGILVVTAASVASFRRAAPGRVRTSTPRWHVPPQTNQAVLTTITARLRPGQEEGLHCLVQQMRQTDAHCLPGTAARYMVRNQADPNEIEILLLWRSASVPTKEQQEAALAALITDLKEIVDWDQARVKEGNVVLHAC